MNKERLLQLVDLELKSRNPMGGNWDREFILNSYRKLKKENLTHDEIIRRIVKEFKGFDEDYWKQKIERVLFSEGLTQKNAIGDSDIVLKNDIRLIHDSKWSINKIVKVDNKIGIITKIINK